MIACHVLGRKTDASRMRYEAVEPLIAITRLHMKQAFLSRDRNKTYSSLNVNITNDSRWRTSGKLYKHGGQVKISTLSRRLCV